MHVEWLMLSSYDGYDESNILVCEYSAFLFSGSDPTLWCNHVHGVVGKLNHAEGENIQFHGFRANHDHRKFVGGDHLYGGTSNLRKFSLVCHRIANVFSLKTFPSS